MSWPTVYVENAKHEDFCKFHSCRDQVVTLNYYLLFANLKNINKRGLENSIGVCFGCLYQFPNGHGCLELKYFINIYDGTLAVLIQYINIFKVSGINTEE